EVAKVPVARFAHLFFTTEFVKLQDESCFFLFRHTNCSLFFLCANEVTRLSYNWNIEGTGLDGSGQQIDCSFAPETATTEKLLICGSKRRRRQRNPSRRKVDPPSWLASKVGPRPPTDPCRSGRDGGPKPW